MGVAARGSLLSTRGGGAQIAKADADSDAVEGCAPPMRAELAESMPRRRSTSECHDPA
jgi:hypothetical protein